MKTSSRRRPIRITVWNSTAMNFFKSERNGARKSSDEPVKKNSSAKDRKKKKEGAKKRKRDCGKKKKNGAWKKRTGEGNLKCKLRFKGAGRERPWKNRLSLKELLLHKRKMQLQQWRQLKQHRQKNQPDTDLLWVSIVVRE